MADRSKGEPLNKLVARFIPSRAEKRSFQDLKQRLEADYAESRKTKK